jgi:uncharacterized integral membrane protein
MFLIIRLAFALLLFIATIAVYLRNDGPVHLDLYLQSFDAPLAMLLAAALGAGLVLGYVASLTRQWKLHRESRRLARRLARVQSDLDGLQANIQQEQSRHAGQELVTMPGGTRP